MGYYEDICLRWHVEVKGLTTLDGGAVVDPNAEPWFKILVDTGTFKWYAITKDGISYRHLHNKSGGRFSPRDRPMVQEAIEHYVNENLCEGVG